ncbi:MAG TPA: protein kinase [Verrucomicrobiae bacterium]|nr:protein kinase [Verrucomicrobiae bacterium]
MDNTAPAAKPSPGQNREEAIFNAAVTLPNADRAVYLQAACGMDSALRQRLEKLVDAHGRAGDFLEPGSKPAPPGPTIVLTPPSEQPGDQIEHYKIREQIGEGGCGVVYVAEQTEPVRRRVALKVIKLGMDTRSVIARFEAERQALAMMDHPNIARVLDAGSTETGRPYFVMELVRGIKITDYCDQNHLRTEQRLELFTQVCHAVQHAHQKGIIHRDIKPSNILVTLHDGVPVPKVIDFGIAKATEGRLTDLTVYTELHQFIGTPAYMSPEQAEMSGLDIDTRSDIYSLGVLLYELLTGGTPFDARELLRAGLDEMRRTIREREPERPSTRLSTLVDADLTAVAKRQGSEPPRLLHLIRGDLDWIVMKALEKDRTRRFQTANALAADVQRFLNNEPVEARPPSRAYRFQKMVRRNKSAFLAAASIVVALVLGLSISLYLFVQERQALRLEKLALQRAIAAEKQQALLREEAEKGLAIERRMREIAPIGDKLNQAGFLLSQGHFDKAEDLLKDVPLIIPQSSSLFDVIGEYHARRQEWSGAITNFTRAVLVDPTNHFAFHYLAPLLAFNGDRAGYEKLRQTVLARFGAAKDPTVAERMAKDCMILPPDPDQLDQLSTMADTALRAGPGNSEWPYFQFAKGLAEYRRGDFKNAIEPLQNVIANRADPTRTVQAYSVLAMAQYHQHQVEAAKASLDAATVLEKEKLEKVEGLVWNDRLTALVLLKEAREVIEGREDSGASR